jgi:hypothetical protein
VRESGLVRGLLSTTRDREDGKTRRRRVHVRWRSSTTIVVTVSVVVFVALLLVAWVRVALDWDYPAGGVSPSTAQATELRHELVDGLQTGDEALFLRAMPTQRKQGEQAWARCEPWVAGAHVSFHNDVDPNFADVQVHVAGNLHEGCEIGAEWRGSRVRARWNVTSWVGLEPAEPNPLQIATATPTN